MQSATSLEKTLILEKIEGRRKRVWQRMRWLNGHHQHNGHESEQLLGDSERQGSLCAAADGVAKSWTRLNDWTRKLTEWFLSWLVCCTSIDFPGKGTMRFRQEDLDSLLQQLSWASWFHPFLLSCSPHSVHRYGVIKREWPKKGKEGESFLQGEGQGEGRKPRSATQGPFLPARIPTCPLLSAHPHSLHGPTSPSLIF